jgi:RNA polymerase sigma-70 factor (ECF subfamily)
VTERERQRTFENWLALHKALIFKVVRAYTTSDADRDDLFQEIVIQVWRSIPSFRQESSVTTWLYRIALNTAIKYSKKERKRSHGEALDDVQHLLHEVEPFDERLSWLYEAIQRLDKVDRSISLLLLEGFTYKEMAVMLGITESNVGVKINRIKKQLIEQSKK